MQNKQTIRSGILGAGFAGSFHFDALRRVHGVEIEIAGIYDLNEGRAGVFAEERDIKAFRSADELIADADVIHVCVPVAAHEKMAVKALEQDKSVILEKPMVGYCGDGSADFNGESFSRQAAIDSVRESLRNLLDAEKRSEGRILYAENWVYAPAVQKEREVIEKTKGQILWMHGEEAHSGSHSPAYGEWRFSGGGSMIGKGCHPLSAALYLKRIEGIASTGHPVRPKTVSARTHAITRQPAFRDAGHIRSDYKDVEDLSFMHTVFEDGTVADIIASELVLGGIHNWIEVCANNHRTVCNINPNTAMLTYNPVETNFKDIYTVEKGGSKQGWAFTSPDEDWLTGYPQELEAFYRAVAYGGPVDSDSALGADCILTIYSAYLSAERNGQEVEVECF